MRKSKRGRSGFTLIEMMVAIAIVGVLSSIAAGAFLFYMDRAKLSEAPTLLADLVKKEMAYFTTPRIDTVTRLELRPCFLGVIPTPAAIGMNKVPFVADAWGNTDVLGFRPSGNVYTAYGVFGSVAQAYCPTPNSFALSPMPDQWYARVNAYADLDGDSVLTTIAQWLAGSAHATMLGGFVTAPCDSIAGYTTRSYLSRWLGTDGKVQAKAGSILQITCP